MACRRSPIASGATGDRWESFIVTITKPDGTTSYYGSYAETPVSVSAVTEVTATPTETVTPTETATPTASPSAAPDTSATTSTALYIGIAAIVIIATIAAVAITLRRRK